jgi:hypothetical protein
MVAGDPVCIAPEEFGSDLSPDERRFYQEMKKKDRKRKTSGPALSGAGCGSLSSGFLLEARDE